MNQVSRITRNNVIFFNCDIQTLFQNPKFMYNPQQVINCAIFMNRLAGVFGIPVISTEQNPKAFGVTVQEVKDSLPKNHFSFEKNTFTMINDDGKKILSQFPDRRTAVIYGIEAHICVLQTCLDLLQLGYRVHLLTDGTSSSKLQFRQTAYEKLKSSGAILDSSQSVAYEILGSSKDPQFKSVLDIVKTTSLEHIFPHL